MFFKNFVADVKEQSRWKRSRENQGFFYETKISKNPGHGWLFPPVPALFRQNGKKKTHQKTTFSNVPHRCITSASINEQKSIKKCKKSDSKNAKNNKSDSKNAKQQKVIQKMQKTTKSDSKNAKTTKSDSKNEKK